MRQKAARALLCGCRWLISVAQPLARDVPNMLCAVLGWAKPMR